MQVENIRNGAVAPINLHAKKGNKTCASAFHFKWHKHMNKYWITSAILFTHLTTGAPPAHADDDKFASEWIGVASFQKQKFYTEDDAPTKNDPIALFFSTCTLQGPNCEIIPVHFHEEWFKPDSNDSDQASVKRPLKNSKWILFIKYAVPIKGGFYTYKENEGRMPYSRKNLALVFDGIERANPSKIFKPTLRAKMQRLIEEWKPGYGDLQRFSYTDSDDDGSRSLKHKLK